MVFADFLLCALPAYFLFFFCCSSFHQYLNLKAENSIGASADPAAAEDDFTIVEDGRLAGRDGALGRIESNARAIFRNSFRGGGRGRVLVADFYEGANRSGRLFARDPIHVFNFKCRGTQKVVFANNDAVLLWIDGENVERLAGGEAEALTLANRKVVNAIVAADHVAGFVDDFAFRTLQRNSALLRVRPDELDVIAGGHET